MNEVTVNMDNLTTEEREQLLALVEKANKKPFEVWKPTESDKGCMLQGDGYTWEYPDLESSKKYHKQGRAFKTKAEAEFFSEQERILTQYKRLAAESWAGEKIDWNDHTEEKYYIDMQNEKMSINSLVCLKFQGTVYFKTKESLESAIKTIGEENTIKYLF